MVLWQQAHALMPWCGEIEVNASNLVVPPFACALLSGGAWKHFVSTGATVALTSLSAVSDAWRYAYIVDAGGGLPGIAFDATGPDAARVWKDGTTGTHRYLCPIRMSSVAGAAVPLRGRNGHWVYAIAQAVASVTAGGSTTQSLASRVPPHVRRAQVIAKASEGGGHSMQADLGSAGNPSIVVYAGAAGAVQTASADMVTTASQQISCLASISGSGPALDILVGAFDE